jgi:uncharacterized protein (TIGR02271 family)
VEATLLPTPRGWTVRLPLRADIVSVRRRAVVAEEVVVRRRRVESRVRHRDRLRREVPRLYTGGELEVDAPPDLAATRQFDASRWRGDSP